MMTFEDASMLVSGQVIQPGQKIFSENGQYVLIMQHDQNLVLYAVGEGNTEDSNKPLWASNTGSASEQDGAAAVLLEDGNFVVFSIPDQNNILWQSNTSNSGSNVLIVQIDGNLVLYNAIWATNTNVPTPPAA